MRITEITGKIPTGTAPLSDEEVSNFLLSLSGDLNSTERPVAPRNTCQQNGEATVSQAASDKIRLQKYQEKILQVIEPRIFAQDFVHIHVPGREIKSYKEGEKRTICVNAQGIMSGLLVYEVCPDGKMTISGIKGYEGGSEKESIFYAYDGLTPFPAAVLDFIFETIDMTDTDEANFRGEPFCEEAYLEQILPKLFNGFQRKKVFRNPASACPETIRSDYQVQYVTDYGTLNPTIALTQRERIPLPLASNNHGPVAYIVQESPEIYTFRMNDCEITISLLDLASHRPFIKTNVYYQAVDAIATAYGVLEANSALE